MAGQLQGKVIAITGAASGIAHASALECAARGASLALADLNVTALNQVITDLKTQFPNVDVIGSELNVTSSASVDEWTASVVKHFGRIDGAANLAGVDSSPGQPSYQSIVDMSDEHWQFIQNVNCTGLFYCVRAQLRVMGKGGSIVNAASTAGLKGAASFSAYCTSKHGVIGLTKSAAKESGERGIRVNAVCPGPVDTPLLRRMLNNDDAVLNRFRDAAALKRLGERDEIAKALCFLLSDDSSWVNGTTLTLDGCALAS